MYLDQQFASPFIEGQEESKYPQKDSIQTPTNILSQNKAEMTTYPPEMQKKSSICSKNCIYNKLSFPLFLLVLALLLVTVTMIISKK